jgi:hypothetical protein
MCVTVKADTKREKRRKRDLVESRKSTSSQNAEPRCIRGAIVSREVVMYVHAT